MNYKPGDIVEFNFNGCLWPDLPSVECEIVQAQSNSSGIFRLKLPDSFDSMWTTYLAMDTTDTFTCHQDWFRLAPVKPVQVDISNLL